MKAVNRRSCRLWIGYRLSVWLVVLAIVFAAVGGQTTAGGGVAHAQDAPQAVPEPSASPEPPVSQLSESDEDQPSAMGPQTERMRRPPPVVRIGQDHTVPVGEHVDDVVVVFGSATIDGLVNRDVAVVFGTLRLGPTAEIRGSAVVVGGSAIVESGAKVGRDFTVVGGRLQAPADFRPGSESVVVGGGVFGPWFEAASAWLTRGLLWGRLIVPSLPWIWAVAAVFVAVYLVLNLLFDRAVRVCRETIVERPLSVVLIGLLVLVLLGPVSFLLSVSVIGVPVVLFLALGLVVAAMLGKIGVTRWIGSSIVAEPDVESRLASIRSFAIGSTIILAAYMVPVLGVLAWAISGVMGVGAATLAFSAGLRRENPRWSTPEPVRSAVSDAPPYTGSVAADAFGQVPNVPSAASEFRPEQESGAAAFGASVGVERPAYAPPTAGDLLSMPKARFLDRLAAFALDVLLISLAYRLFNLEEGPPQFFFLLLSYYIVAWALKATTVGGAICNLRVVRTDGRPLSLGDALIRGLASIFSLVALGLGCLWILYDAENQAWHDRFAGTYVVKVPRNWPL